MFENEVTFNGKEPISFGNHSQDLAQIIRQKFKSGSLSSADFPVYPVARQSRGSIDMSRITDQDSSKCLQKGFKEFTDSSFLPRKNEESINNIHQFRLEIERLHEKNNRLEDNVIQKNNEIERLNSIVKDLQSKHLFTLQALEDLRSELMSRDLKLKSQVFPSPSTKLEKRSTGRRNSSVSTAYNSTSSIPKKPVTAPREMTGKYSGIFLIAEHVIFKQRSTDDMGKQEQCMPFISRVNHNWMTSLRSDSPSSINTRSKSIKEVERKPVALNFTPSECEFSYEDKK